MTMNEANRKTIERLFNENALLQAENQRLRIIRDWVASDIRFPYLTLPKEIIYALDATHRR